MRSLTASHSSRRTLCGSAQRLLGCGGRKSTPALRVRFHDAKCSDARRGFSASSGSNPHARCCDRFGARRRVTANSLRPPGQAAPRHAGTSSFTRPAPSRVHTSCSAAPPDLLLAGAPAPATCVHAWRRLAALLPAWWVRRRLSRPRLKALLRAAPGGRTCVRWAAMRSCARRWWRPGHRR